MMDYRKRLEKSHMLENRNIQRLNAVKDRALTKHANKWAKDRETHPDGLRRPLWMGRPLTPQKAQFYLKKE